MSTVTGVSISNTNNKMDEYFVDSESIITNEQRSLELEQQNPEMNHSSLEFQEVTHAVGMLVRKGAQGKDIIQEGKEGLIFFSIQAGVHLEANQYKRLAKIGPQVTLMRFKQEITLFPEKGTKNLQKIFKKNLLSYQVDHHWNFIQVTKVK